MNDKQDFDQVENVENRNNSLHAGTPEKAEGLPANLLKRNSKGIVLVPQPSNDPCDPLNWSNFKKGTTLAIVCLAAFSVLLQALANASGFFYQATLYHKTPVEISYCVSAAIAGIVMGPLIWTPIGTRFGKAAIIFWSMILTLLMNVWSASMTKETQYIPFVISRLFAGLFGSAPLTVGSNIIVEIVFLHDRGKCFALYTFSILVGGICCGTFSGYIVQRVSWTVQFWYNVGLEGCIAILCLIFLDETAWSRPGQPPVPYPPSGFFTRKIATYAFTQRLTATRSRKEVIESWTLPFSIAACPVTILIGTNLMVYYGFGISINTFLSIFLQSPVEEGGYGFSPDRNASFTFVMWVGALSAQLYGFVVGDRLPLAICARNGGVWKPEYRLHSTWIPLFVCFPLGVGLFGGCLYYHWHYMVLAFAVFISNFGAVSAFPPMLNYVIESFSPALANETAAAINFYRTTLAIAITFFLFPWADRVGINWAFGMMAIFTAACYASVVICMIWGPQLRARSIVRVKSEAGVHLVDRDTPVQVSPA